MPYRHFTSDERDALQVLLDKELEVALIARILGKHNSSIYREIERNQERGVYLFYNKYFSAFFVLVTAVTYGQNLSAIIRPMSQSARWYESTRSDSDSLFS